MLQPRDSPAPFLFGILHLTRPFCITSRYEESSLLKWEIPRSLLVLSGVFTYKLLRWPAQSSFLFVQLTQQLFHTHTPFYALSFQITFIKTCLWYSVSHEALHLRRGSGALLFGPGPIQSLGSTTWHDFRPIPKHFRQSRSTGLPPQLCHWLHHQQRSQLCRRLGEENLTRMGRPPWHDLN